MVKSTVNDANAGNLWGWERGMCKSDPLFGISCIWQISFSPSLLSNSVFFPSIPCFDQIKWAKLWFTWLSEQISPCKAIPLTFCFLSHTNTHTLVNTGEKKQAVPVQVNEFDTAYLEERESSWKQSTLGQIQKRLCYFCMNCHTQIAFSIDFVGAFARCLIC